MNHGYSIGATLEINTTIGCTLACVYCPQRLVTKAYKKTAKPHDRVMTFETFKRCLDKLPAGVRIDFSGMAEPWLNKDCTKMVLYANSRGHKIQIFTTGVGMTEEDITAIEHIPFDKFVIHLPDDNNKNTKIPHGIEDVEKISKIKSSHIDCVDFCVIGNNVHPAFKEIAPPSLKPTLIISRGGNLDKEDIGSRGLKTNTSSTGKNKGRIFCSVVEQYLNHNVLFPNGDVSLCCMDYGLKYILGNLLKNDYADLFCSDEYKRIKDGLKKDSDILCRYCEIAEPMNYRRSIGKSSTRYKRILMNMLKDGLKKSPAAYKLIRSVYRKIS